MNSSSSDTPEHSLAKLLQKNPAGFLEHMPYGILVLDPAGNLLGANPSAQSLLGLKGEPTPGSPWHECLDESAPETLVRNIESVLESPGASPSPWIVSISRKKEKDNRPVEIRASLIPSENGESLVFIILREVDDFTPELTETNRLLREEVRKHEKVEEELRKERALFENLMNTVPDKIYFKDLNSRFLRINCTHSKQFGLNDPTEAIGKSDFDYFAKSHASKAYAEEQEIIRTGIPMIGKEEKLTLTDGTETWASATKVPLRDLEGRIIGTVGISRDITRSKHAEEALTEERNLLRTLIDLLPTRIFVKDREARYIINNISHLRHLGVSLQEDAAGKKVTDFFSGERGEQALADDRMVIDTGESISEREVSYIAEDGLPRWSLTTKVPLRDTRDRIAGLVGLSHDITERKNAEEELRRRNEEMRADLKVAYEIQQSFLTLQYPHFPAADRPGKEALCFNHRYLPASTLAGDFFEIFRVSDSLAGILVCDVMGHGVRAALITAYMRGLIEEIMSRAEDPGAFLTEINRGLVPILRHADSPTFVTAFYAVADTDRNELRYANAGHPLPFMLRRRAGKAVRLKSPSAQRPGPAVGLLESFDYATARTSLEKQDLAVLFTDGLFEVENSRGKLFGEERLKKELEQRISIDTPRLLDEITNTVKEYAQGDVFTDDVCIVTVETT